MSIVRTELIEAGDLIPDGFFPGWSLILAERIVNALVEPGHDERTEDQAREPGGGFGADGVVELWWGEAGATVVTRGGGGNPGVTSGHPCDPSTGAPLTREGQLADEYDRERVLVARERAATVAAVVEWLRSDEAKEIVRYCIDKTCTGGTDEDSVAAHYAVDELAARIEERFKSSAPGGDK